VLYTCDDELPASDCTSQNTVDAQLFLRLHRDPHREYNNRETTHTLAVTHARVKEYFKYEKILSLLVGRVAQSV
jgi:hypothetical protein